MAHPLDAALAGADLTNANTGATTVKSYLSVVASTTISTAQINQTLFVTPLIQLSVDTTSGGWANNKPGMDVWIGSSAGLNDIGIYRLRDSQSNYILIGEVGAGDPGLLTPGIRNTSFADNQFVTIVNRFSPWAVLPLISQGVIYEDYGVLVSDGPANWNSHPPPLVQVKCTSTNRTEYNHIACFIDAGQTYATITFLASTSLWPTSASATYLWTVPGSWTVTGGSVSTATFTAQVPNAATNYVLELAVTENGGNISKRHVMVWVHTRTGANAPLTISGLSGDSWDRTGAKLTFALKDSLLANLPDGAMVCIWQEATFNGATIATAVDQFVGWIVRINKTTEPGLRTAEPEFVGPAGILDFKRGTSQIFDVTAGTPANWQQLPASLMSLSFAQFWLLSWRARGILELFDFMVYSTDATGQRLPELVIPPGNLWSQLSSLADGIGKRNIGCDPDGTIWVQPHPSLIDYASRSGIVQRDTLSAARYRDVDWPREMFDKTSLVEGEGFIWDGSATLPTPILSIAPGFSMGQGGGDTKVQGQCVADQTALNVLTGNYYRLQNPDYPDLTININGNRGALYKPAQMAMGRLQIPPNLTPENVAFDRYFVPKEVRRSYKDNGAVSSSIVGEVETSGVPGTTKPVPLPNITLYADMTILIPPITSTFGGDTGVSDTPPVPIPHIATDGNVLLGATTTRVYWITDFINLTTPHYNDVTPTNLGAFIVRAVAISPFFTDTAIPAYVLASDGTNSAVWYTSNVAAGSPIWNKGVSISGVYSVLRVGNTNGSLEVYTFDSSGGGSLIDTLTIPTDGSAVLTAANTTLGASYRVRGTGTWLAHNTPTLTHADAQWSDNTTDSAGNWTASASNFGLALDGPRMAAIPYTTSHDYSWIVTGTGNKFSFNMLDNASYLDNSGTITVQLYLISGANSQSSYSSDNGSTFAAPLTIAASRGVVGGFDIQRAGANQFAGAGGKVYRATVLGGAWSAYYTITGGVEAACVIIPYFNWAGTNQTSATNPDIVVGFTGADGSSRTLLWIEGGATPGTIHDITPVAGSSFDNANSVTTSYSHHIALFCIVSGTYKLYRTTNQGGAWTLVGARTSPKYIRGRRGDTSSSVSGTNLGQLYMADVNMYWSSLWDSTGPWIRNMPSTPIITFDPLY